MLLTWFGILLVYAWLADTTEGICSVETYPKYHYMELAWTPLYVKVGSGGPILRNLNNNQHDKFYFITKFYDCNDNTDYISSKSVAPVNTGTGGMNQQYLARMNSDNSLDLQADSGGPYSSSSDSRLFIYKGGRDADLTSFSKRVGGGTKYITYNLRSGAVRIGNQEIYWVTWPYISSALPLARRKRAISMWRERGIIRKNRQRSPTTQSPFRLRKTRLFRRPTTEIHMSFPTSSASVDVQLHLSAFADGIILSPSNLFRTSSQATNLEKSFEVLVWRLYKGFDVDGNIVIGKAVILRAPNTENYVTIKTSMGVILTTSELCRQGRCVAYGNVQVTFYNEAQRCINSTFLKSEIEKQTAVDERFFEVLEDATSGKARFRSTLDPRKYLAILVDSVGDVQLVIAEMTTDAVLTRKIRYDFTLSVPPQPSQVRTLPRLPCDSATPVKRRSQLSLFTCLWTGSGSDSPINVSRL